MVFGRVDFMGRNNWIYCSDLYLYKYSKFNLFLPFLENKRISIFLENCYENAGKKLLIKKIKDARLFFIKICEKLDITTLSGVNWKSKIVYIGIEWKRISSVRFTKVVQEKLTAMGLLFLAIKSGKFRRKSDEITKWGWPSWPLPS